MGIFNDLWHWFAGGPVNDKAWFPNSYQLWLNSYTENGTDRPDDYYKAENKFDCLIETDTYNLRENGFNDKPIGTKIIKSDGSVYHCNPDRDCDRWRYMTVRVRFHDIARIKVWKDDMGITVFCKNGVVFKKKIPDPEGCLIAFNEYLATVPKEKIEVW